MRGRLPCFLSWKVLQIRTVWNWLVFPPDSTYMALHHMVAPCTKFCVQSTVLQVASPPSTHGGWVGGLRTNLQCGVQ